MGGKHAKEIKIRIRNRESHGYGVRQRTILEKDKRIFIYKCDALEHTEACHMWYMVIGFLST